MEHMYVIGFFDDYSRAKSYVESFGESSYHYELVFFNGLWQVLYDGE